jgi:hypothetical protein
VLKKSRVFVGYIVKTSHLRPGNTGYGRPTGCVEYPKHLLHKMTGITEPSKSIGPNSTLRLREDRNRVKKKSKIVLCTTP